LGDRHFDREVALPDSGEDGEELIGVEHIGSHGRRASVRASL
jgi:hypothetical protein